MKKLYKVLIALTLVLNAIDCGLTVCWLSTGQAIEVNSAMNYLYSLHPIVFIIVKNVFVGICSVWLWLRVDAPTARAGIWIVFITYLSLCVYHFGFLIN